MITFYECSQFEGVGFLSVPPHVLPNESIERAKNKYKAQNSPTKVATQKGHQKGLTDDALQRYVDKTIPLLIQKHAPALGRIPMLIRIECHSISMQSALPPKTNKDTIYLIFNEPSQEFSAHWYFEDKCIPHPIDGQAKIEALTRLFKTGKTVKINQPNFHDIKSLCGYPSKFILQYKDEGSAPHNLPIEIRPEWQLVFTDELQLKSIFDLPEELADIIQNSHKCVNYHTVPQFTDKVLSLSQQEHDFKFYYAHNQTEATKLARKHPDFPILFEHENKLTLRGHSNRKWQPQEIKNWEKFKEGLDLKTNPVIAKEWTSFHRHVMEKKLHVFHSIDYPAYVLFNKSLMIKLLSKYRSHQTTLDKALGEEFNNFNFHVHRHALCLMPTDLKDQKDKVFIAANHQREQLYNAYLFILLTYAGIIKNNAHNHTCNKDEKDIQPNRDKGITGKFEKSHMLPAKNKAQALSNASKIRSERDVTLSSSIDGDEDQQQLLFNEVESKSASKSSKAVYYDHCLGLSKDAAAKKGCIVSSVAFVSESKFNFTQIPLETKDIYTFEIYNHQDEIKNPQANIFYVKATTDLGLEYMVLDPTELLAKDVIPTNLIPYLPGTLTTSNISTYWPSIRDIVRQKGQIAMELTSLGHIFYSLWQNSKGEHFIHHLESMLIGKTEDNYKLKGWTPIFNQGKGPNKHILCYSKLGSILNSLVMEPLASQLTKK